MITQRQAIGLAVGVATVATCSGFGAWALVRKVYAYRAATIILLSGIEDVADILSRAQGEETRTSLRASTALCMTMHEARRMLQAPSEQLSPVNFLRSAATGLVLLGVSRLFPFLHQPSKDVHHD